MNRDGAFRDWVNERFADPLVRAELIRCDANGRGDRRPLFRCWKQHAGEPMTQRRLGCGIAVRLKPDTELLNALTALSRLAKLGVITNGTSESQRQKIHAAQLDQAFAPDHLWISAEIGKAKPDPAIFLMASSALGVPPGQCLFVGDREDDDVAGARAAGMQARLVKAPLNAVSLAELLRGAEVA